MFEYEVIYGAGRRYTADTMLGAVSFADTHRPALVYRGDDIFAEMN